jgi:hypothetical protein
MTEMWTWVVALFVLAAGISLRWLSRRTDTLGRRRPFPWISVTVCVLAGCAALIPWVLRIRLEHRLGDAASAMVGGRVEVHCQTFGEAFVDTGAEFGYVPFGPDGVPARNTVIKREQCGDLADYLRSDKTYPSRDQVVAVHVLTHESIHMTGETNESITECLAVQRDMEMAKLLGAGDADAHALARTYWETVYPHMPDGYRSDECGPGLELDLGLSDPPWPLVEANS